MKQFCPSLDPQVKINVFIFPPMTTMSWRLDNQSESSLLPSNSKSKLKVSLNKIRSLILFTAVENLTSTLPNITLG